MHPMSAVLQMTAARVHTSQHTSRRHQGEVCLHTSPYADNQPLLAPRMFLNGRGWWVWTSESNCKNLGKMFPPNPNLCTGTGGMFSVFRGNVTLPGGYTVQRWSDHPGSNHSMFFEPASLAIGGEVV